MRPGALGKIAVGALRQSRGVVLFLRNYLALKHRLGPHLAIRGDAQGASCPSKRACARSSDFCCPAAGAGHRGLA